MQPQFLSAEPMADHIVAVTTVGAVDLDDINVNLNGKVDSCYILYYALP